MKSRAEKSRGIVKGIFSGVTRRMRSTRNVRIA